MFTTPRAISKTIGTAVSTVAALSLAGNCAFAQPADISKQVDKIFTPLVTSKQIPGVAVAVISGGKVLYKKGYGVTDLSEKSPMTTDAVFDLASVSKQFTATYCDDTPGFVGDGSAFSTIDDLIKYDLALRSGKLLNAESMKVLTTSGKLNNGSLTAYGCGWNVTDDHGHKLTWHDGSWNGTSTYFARFQDKPTSIIVLVNAVEQSADDMGDKVADILFPQE